MPTTYTAANITRFGGPDDWVSGDEADTGFAVTGTANYTGTAPVAGSTVSLSFVFSDGGSQVVTTTVGTVDATNQTIGFTVNDPSLTLPEGAGSYTARVSNIDGVLLSSTSSPSHAFNYITCFVRGTEIATPDGSARVEDLVPGNMVITSSHGPATVKWIGRRRIDVAPYPRREMVAPVRIIRDAFAPGIPRTDLLISPDHAILADGRLICARQLVNGASIRYDLSFDSVEYFHIELDRHDVLLAEGLTVESYLNTGNRGFFSNAPEPLILHPDLSDDSDLVARETASCLPFATDAPTVRPIWDRLAARAAALGQPVNLPSTLNNPNLRIAVKGRTITPIFAAEGLHVFVLPKSARELRILSSASVPSDLQPWLDDRRSLGVCVQRIVVRSAEEYEEIPVDSPHLSNGWWDAEGDGRKLWRWTDGEAVLPVSIMSGPRMLEIRVAPTVVGYHADTPEQSRRVA